MISCRRKHGYSAASASSSSLFADATWPCLQSKQNQCWSVSQVPSTTRLSEEFCFSKKKKLLKKQNHNDKHRTKNQAAQPCSANLTVTRSAKQGEKTHVRIRSSTLAPPNGGCTSLISHPTLFCCSPSSVGDSVNAATVGVPQGEKKNRRLSLVEDKKTQFTYCHS